jgi:hypothetical protein
MDTRTLSGNARKKTQSVGILTEMFDEHQFAATFNQIDHELSGIGG